VGEPVKIIDRTALILDIFGVHATTREGRLQVQLAQLQYVLPRLRGMWSHSGGRADAGAAFGRRFGQGESQLEVDRRLVRKRISTGCATSSTRLETRREVQVQSSVGVRRVYRVSRSCRLYQRWQVDAAQQPSRGPTSTCSDELFATLDPTTRVNRPGGGASQSHAHGHRSVSSRSSPPPSWNHLSRPWQRFGPPTLS
jgi:GTP-binding protein HflX